MGLVKRFISVTAWSIATTTVIIAAAQMGGSDASEAGARNEPAAGGGSGEEPAGGGEADVPPPPPEPPPPEPPPPLGEMGESCRARADCEPTLRCVANVCRQPSYGAACSGDAECAAPLKCLDAQCRDRAEAPPSDAGTDDFWAPRMAAGAPGETDVRAIIGLHLAGGPGAGVDLASTGSIDPPVGMILFTARGGVLVERFEATLEVGLDVFHVSADPVFLMGANAGYYLPLLTTENTDLSWPLRLGAGFVAGEGLGPTFQMRLDAVGIAFNRGPFLLEAHLPSFRFISDFEDRRNRVRFSAMQWMFGGSGSYIF